MKNIDEIVQELIAIEPSFAVHEPQMRSLIAELLKKKPDTHLDEQFVARLRAQLQGAPTPSPFSWYSYLPYGVVAVLAIALVLPISYYISNNSGASGDAVFAMNQQIEKLPGGAYGALQSQEGGRGGGGAATLGADAAKSYRATSAPVAMPTAPMAEMAVGSGVASSPANAVSTDAKMMVPQGPVTTYSYVYKGDPLELSDTEGDVYRRVPGKVSSAQIATQLKKFNFSLVNLGAFADMRVRSFELVEDKPMGYSISANFDDGSISINPDYMRWPALSGKEMAPQQLPQSAMPSNDETIAIAKRFLDDHDISLANYGDPVVQDYAQMGAADSQMQFAPEQVTVTYPLKIKGTPVYEDGAYPYGLQVGVSVRDKRVMSVYGLTSQTYSSSAYKLETDSSKILSVLDKGGPHAWVPEPSSGLEIKKVEIEVGTPTKVLMHSYNYTNGESQELFVPALSFPVTHVPAGEQYYPKYIVIPLVPELINREGQGPVMYDMMR